MPSADRLRRYPTFSLCPRWLGQAAGWWLWERPPMAHLSLKSSANEACRRRIGVRCDGHAECAFDVHVNSTG